MINLSEAIPMYKPGAEPGTGVEIDLIVGADTHYDGEYLRIDRVHLHTLPADAETLDVPRLTVVLAYNPINRCVTVYRAYVERETDPSAFLLGEVTTRFTRDDRANNTVAWRDFLAWLWRVHKPATLPDLLPKGADT